MSGQNSPRRISGISSAENSTKYDRVSSVDPDVLPTDMRHRRKTTSEHSDELNIEIWPRRRTVSEQGHENELDTSQEGLDNGFVVMPPENAIEAHRMVNNYKV